MSPRILLIDNYDSFTYNLVQGFMALGAEVIVHYNDDIDQSALSRLDPTHLVISPGPGRPQSAGNSIRIIEAAAGTIPILGVCLGHQAIATVFKGSIGHATQLMHGKTSPIHHDRQTIYHGMHNPFTAGRYHSLSVTADDLPTELEVTAIAPDGEIMGIRHTTLPIEGIQFHPESILTPDGNQLMSNFLRLTD